MKKIFTLMAIMLSVLTANADNVTMDMELTGSNLTLPPTYLTGRAEFQNFKTWGEVTFFDKEQTSGKDPYEIYMEEWPILHLEFESITENLQMKFSGDTDKYWGFDDVSVLTYDIELAQTGLDFDTPIYHIGLQSKANQTETVVIKKCCLVNGDGEELPLYYINNGNGGWGVKVVGDARLLSGKVEFNANSWAQLGGAPWCPEELKTASNAIWTIEFSEPVATDQLQVIIDADKTYYLSEFIQPGATSISYDVNAYHAESAYSPELASSISQFRIQVKAKLEESVFLNIKSVKLTLEGDLAGINTVTKDVNGDAPIYNLSGQRVNTLTKGIYIQNGRKFMVK